MAIRRNLVLCNSEIIFHPTLKIEVFSHRFACVQKQRTKFIFYRGWKDWYFEKFSFLGTKRDQNMNRIVVVDG